MKFRRAQSPTTQRPVYNLALVDDDHIDID